MQTSAGDREQAYRDLESYRIELGMKNEELRRAQAELEALRERENTFCLLFERLGAPFLVQEVITDASGQPVDLRFLEVNASAEKHLGRTRAELIGHRRSEVLGALDQGVLDFISRVLASDTPLCMEVYSPATGRWYEVLSYSPRPGQLANLTCDITERKQAEAEREQLVADLAAERESLEIGVQERTEALVRLNEELCREFAAHQKAEAALVRSEKLAAIGKLAAGLAHEIKNPLQAVMGCAQLAEEEMPADEKAATYLRMIIQEAQRISALVGELRDLQRPVPEEGRQLICVNEVVEKQLALNGSRASEQRVEVEWQPAEDLPPVWGVDRRLQQVFLNLLLNALEVMPEGGQIRVRSEADPEAKGVWLHITDTGPGIPDDVLPHVFEPFYTTYDEGQGLGLFICHNIVVGHGGRIEVDSQVGEGTTFSVCLPAAQAE
jgi:signal transduction histidine kinase